VRAGGRLVIAIDGKAVRGAKDREGEAPHLVAALAHGIGAVRAGRGYAGKPGTLSPGGLTSSQGLTEPEHGAPLK
jgi:hypothetical protein